MTAITATISTHGLILLENFCRRMRAMVVRTTNVVHMVFTSRDLPPRGPTVVQITVESSPIERLEW